MAVKVAKTNSEDTIISNIVSEIIRTRKEKNMSLEELADKAQVDIQIIEKLENLKCDDIEVTTFIKILDVLDLSIEIVL